MKRVKRRTFSGVVCEQEVYTIPDRADPKKAEYRPRFENDEDRARHRNEMSRRNHTRLFNANFTPESLYSTLTFDSANECHDAKECRLLRDRYFRRLRRACPDGVIFLYYGQGKNTHRFHLHMVTDGIPEEVIKGKWTFGSVTRVDHLRERCVYDGVDHGPDYTGLANYLFDHWREEFGGHRFKCSRNLRRPEREDPREAKRVYTEEKPPRAPKGYILVETKSNQYGYLYFKYIKVPAAQDCENPKRRC